MNWLNTRSWAVVSPVRTVPAGSSVWNCTEPRLPSREPRPFDSGTPWFATPEGALRAALTSISPEPTSFGSTDATLCAVDVSAYLTRSGAHVGRDWRSNATDPDTTAAAIEVPLPLW